MGERLGRYTVLKHLASGGMADVLLARTDGIEGFSRHVVLKRIKAEHAKDKRFIEMFLDEARLAANLHHQNVVQVHDIGEADGAGGDYFFAMEYLHGEDLRAMLAIVSKTRTHMPLSFVVSVISSVAAGLHYAHERRGPDKKPLNIVHRDVSPSNILIGRDGSVKVVDFGIAKAAMRQAETRSGSLKGKVSYMSPEQCKNAEIDRRSDVYALGVVLYELTTTTRLFKSDSDYLVMDAICTGKIPLPRVRRPDLPNELSTIIMKALATDPERRYQTADELRIALDAFAEHAALTASPSTIGAYVQKLCGDKPEPWLDTGPVAPTSAEADTAADRTVPDSRAPRRTPSHAPATRTSAVLGWEQATPVPAEPVVVGRVLTPARGAMIAVPLLAIVGLLVWKLAGSSEPAATVAVVENPRTVEAVVENPPEPVAVAPVASPPDASPAATAKKPAPKLATTTAKAAEPKVAEPKAAEPKPAEPKVTEPKPAEPKAAEPKVTEPKPAEPKPAATAPAPTIKPAPPVEPKPAPPVEPKPPAVTEAPMAVLAPGAVEAVASRNRKALLACENNETLHGDLAVRFEIDANGRVVKSQVQSTLGKPKVAGCILAQVRSWRFPKPATGSASGVYAISFQ